ncbi:methylated-DNA--cysteine S-met [Trichoderma longibrachiatum ATCC 18648]|uniref:Methylated-DNA--protein-cysteine methyltransferase n=1 Tax=Trichoderma longibrachiatum ATCC 18648 TaxID=983965 RepID=A0A2T4BQP8_TRILO|nr:methylated-DNA--cysteine S-met [Trichoderma longibrachiatum ATCC 18648]
MAPTIQKPKPSKTTAPKPSSTSRIQKPKPKPSQALTTTKAKLPSMPPDMQPQLRLIAQSQRTPFEKRVWAALCQIPRGRVTTYGLLSAHLGTSPRAVGNALRRNPFAPAVPCHRVVATGGALGGFKGSWPRDGEGVTIAEKRSLLRAEGVRVDDRGRVLGTVWSGFE